MKIKTKHWFRSEFVFTSSIFFCDANVQYYKQQNTDILRNTLIFGQVKNEIIKQLGPDVCMLNREQADSIGWQEDWYHTETPRLILVVDTFASMSKTKYLKWYTLS